MIINQPDNSKIKESIENSIRKQKYSKYVKILKQVEENILYKGEVIKGNSRLEWVRENDIKQLETIISNELKHDNINKIFINGKLLKQIKDENINLKK